MRPDELHPRRAHTPLIPQRSFSHTQAQVRPAAQEAAANIVRGQLDTIYTGNNAASSASQPTPPNAQQPISQESPYSRTQTNPADVEAEQWRQYHSAWQDYYQKYYERYYVGQVYRTRQALEARAAEATAAGERIPESPPSPTSQDQTFSRNEAVDDLKTRLRGKIQESAKKARKSRHFVPITAAICVMIVFLFLQYNRVLMSNVQAYISPGAIDPANIIIDPSTDLSVSPDPKLIIPKINVDVPVEYNTTPDTASQMKAMENGVAYFGIPGANSKPGQIGNTVISGHSSNDIIDQGNYKFIFARLDHLDKGDTIYVNYEGTRYTYIVSKKEVVKPTDVNRLVYQTDKPILTLITCTPLGTALNRLLVTAEQVSPSPADAQAAPSDSGAPSNNMPGNSPTFVERILGN